MIRITAALLFATLTTFPVLASAAVPEVQDLTPSFRAAGTKIERLRVYEVGGVVVIRGRALNETEKAEVADTAARLGYSRVANLVTIASAPDDAAIERKAERELSVHRGLDGCTFSVDSNGGVLRVAGRVLYELQKDMALAVLRSIDGVRSVETSLVRE
ncbi:MAG: BON domain-containing protein [Thermoanaerobaculia bacterium]|nr:BON domain-containing protein [Thermoanaerobaculia bacterium]